MPDYKLTYLDGLGIAEPVRLLLQYLDRPFQDSRITSDQWTPEAKAGTPWGKVPVLEIDGKPVCQSMAICRYLGREAGLAGEDSWQSLQIDMLADTAMDMRAEFSAGFREPDEQLKKQKRDKFYSESLPFYLAKFDEIIKQNDEYLVQGQLSWADIVLCNLCQVFSIVGGEDVTENYPNLHSLLAKFLEHPKLSEYIKNRPQTEF